MTDTLGRYKIIREIARGGMGVVYEAEDPTLGRRVAVKTLREGDVGPSIVKRLHREAALAARLRHPNIITVHEVGEVLDGTGGIVHYISMDLIRGRTFSAALEARTHPLKQLVAILEQVARAVQYAHQEGVIHRDLKPGNILIDEKDRPIVMDFGLAKSQDASDRLTRSGAVLGTPFYMAPEQVQGRVSEIDARTDVYALGVTLYETAVHRPPFHSTTQVEIYRRILEEEPPPPRKINPDLEADLETIILKAMAKDRAVRYASARELADDLRRYLAGEPISAHPPSVFYTFRVRLAKRRAVLITALVATVMAAAGAALLTARWRKRHADELAQRLEKEQTRAADRDHRLRILERIKPTQRLIEDARAYFYIPGDVFQEKLRKVEESLGELEKIAAEPDGAGSPDVWATLGLGWYFVGDFAKAHEALVRAEALGSDDGRVAFHLARILLERWMVDLLAWTDGSDDPSWSAPSREPVEKALALLRRPFTGPGAEEIDRQITLAYRALAESNREEVLRLCTEGLQRFPESVGSEEFWNLRGFVAGAEDRGVQIEAYSKAIARRPHYAWAYFMRGTARWLGGDFRAAIADYSAATKINPRWANPWNSLGFAKSRSGDPEGAIAALTEAIRLNPKLAGAHINRGIARRSKGDVAGALADFEMTIQLAPEMAAGWTCRAGILIEKGDFAGAVRDCTEAITRNPKQAVAFYNRGIARVQLGDLEKGLEDYETAIRINPDYPDPYAGRALLKIAHGDRPGGLADFDEAVKRTPKSARFRHDRGSLKWEMGDRLGALDDYDGALALDPNFVMGYYNRAIVRYATGDKKGSLADFEKALELAPANWPQRAKVEQMRDGVKKELGD